MTPKTHCCYCGDPLVQKWIEERMRLFCEKCCVPIYENPVPATCLVVVSPRGRLLLVKRSVEPRKGWWCLPGGYMELGEEPQDAAIRELSEETGIAGVVDRLLGATSNPSDLYHTVLMVGYLVTSFTGEPVAGDDASDIGWFDVRDLPPVAFRSHRKFILQFCPAAIFKDSLA